MEGRTVMVIAHRLSTVQNADQVRGGGGGGFKALWCRQRLRNSATGQAGGGVHHTLPHTAPASSHLQIVVLEGGQVVEQGSHKQLLRRPGGRYAALVSAQELLLQQTRGLDAR